MTDQPAGAEAFVKPEEKSIVDTILDLDALLSAEIRRPERLAPICTSPDLEAELDRLDAELAAAPRNAGPDTPLGAGQRLAHTVAVERDQVAAQMQASIKHVRLRALDADAWDAFEAKHKAVIANPETDNGPMLDELVVLCAVQPTISPAQLAQLRKGLGVRAIAELRSVAWAVNNESGVSVPKSLSSSAALRRGQRARS